MARAALSFLSTEIYKRLMINPSNGIFVSSAFDKKRIVWFVARAYAGMSSWERWLAIKTYVAVGSSSSLFFTMSLIP